MSSGNQKLPQKENGIFKKVVVSMCAHLEGPSCVGELEIVSQTRPTSAKGEGSGEVCIQAVSHWNAICWMT